MATIMEWKYWKVFLLKDWTDTEAVAESLLAAGVIEEVPSKKSNHRFLKIRHEGRVVREAMWWGFKLGDELWFFGLDPWIDLEAGEPVVHGKMGGVRPTDGFVKCTPIYHRLKLQEYLLLSQVESGSLPPILALLATEFFDDKTLGQVLWLTLRKYAEIFWRMVDDLPAVLRGEYDPVLDEHLPEHLAAYQT